MRLLMLAMLLAQEALPPVPPRMPVDETPTAMACTFDAALRDADCAYEAAAGPGDPRGNSKAAAQAGVRACARESHRDAGLRKQCENAVAKASLGPACALDVRLADEQGRLTWDARDCIDELRRAVRRTAFSASLSLKCCSCLEDARCPVPAAQCRDQLDSLAPGPTLGACLARSCRDACPALTPQSAVKQPDPPPPAARPAVDRFPDRI